MKHYVSVYVPSKIGTRKVNNKKVISMTLHSFADQFGGATSYQASGIWKDSAGRLISEDITIVKSYYNRGKQKAINTVVRAAQSIKTSMKQEVVSVEYDGELRFI